MAIIGHSILIHKGIQIQSNTNNYKQTQNVTPWDAQVLVKSRKFGYRKWQPQIQSTTKSFHRVKHG